MSQTKARRLYRRWMRYGQRCGKIGGVTGNRVPLSVARGAMTLFLKAQIPSARIPNPWPVEKLPTDDGSALHVIYKGPP